MAEETAGQRRAGSAGKKATAAKKTTAKKTTAKKTTATSASAASGTAAGATRSQKRTTRDGVSGRRSTGRSRSPKWYDATTAPFSKFFNDATERARKIIQDPEKLQQVARDSAATGAVRSGLLGSVIEEFRALVRLVNAYARGHYREISVESLVLVVAGLLYVVMPIDVIPDTIPGVGFLDDAAVIGWVLKTVREELDAFKAWELGEESGRLRA